MLRSVEDLNTADSEVRGSVGLEDGDIGGHGSGRAAKDVPFALAVLGQRTALSPAGKDDSARKGTLGIEGGLSEDMHVGNRLSATLESNLDLVTRDTTVDGFDATLLGGAVPLLGNNGKVGPGHGVSALTLASGANVGDLDGTSGGVNLV